MAYRSGRRTAQRGGPARGRGAALTAVALVFVLVPSVYAAYLTEVTREAAVAVFEPVDAPYKPTAPVPVESDNDFAVLPTASAAIASEPPATDSSSRMEPNCR